MLGEPLYADTPRRVKIRRVRDAERHAADAVAQVAFGAAGTARGEQGVPEAAALRQRTEARPVRPRRAHLRRLRGEEPVSIASHIPIGAMSEVAGVGTLPDHRRKGLGAALTAAAVADARGMGVETIFLTAGSEESPASTSAWASRAWARVTRPSPRRRLKR